ncbi:MAG: TonB-dependent receptor domain-containing protein, partial [Sphingopyxis sp.]
AQWPGVAFNIAVFDQTLNGFQSNIFTGTGFALANAGKQSVYGFEFDGSVSPVDPLTLTLAVTYLQPKYDSFVNTGIFINGTQIDLTGALPAGIPQLAMAMGAAYVHEFGNGAQLTGRVDYNYESPVHVVENINGQKREVNNLNASLTLALTNGMQFSLWGRNLMNNHYMVSMFPSVAQSGSVSGYPNQPRTYGVNAKFRF